MTAFDPRITAARPDLAAERWRGIIPADRYAGGILMQVVTGTAPLFGAARSDGPMQSELLFGETLTCYERGDDGWCWGQMTGDDYVGYVPSDMLAPVASKPTRRIGSLRSFVYPGPSIKSAPFMALSFGAQLVITAEKDGFSSLAQGGFVVSRHLVGIDHCADDPAAQALMMLGAPYLWGGRSSLGMDCSGLVQLALQACAIACPRDSDQQERALGSTVGQDSDLQRNDLVFWKGHVGIMLDADILLHANGHHMACIAEPLAEARARILAKTGHDISAIKRLDPLPE
jgi:cell wall-associated NlpC family hydrolase